MEKTNNTIRKIHIKSIKDVIRVLSRTFNQLLNNEISVQEANAVGHICNVMIRAFNIDVEEQIYELKTILKKEGIIK